MSDIWPLQQHAKSYREGISRETKEYQEDTEDKTSIPAYGSCIFLCTRDKGDTSTSILTKVYLGFSWGTRSIKPEESFFYLSRY